MIHAQLWKRILHEGITPNYMFNDGATPQIEKQIIRAPIIVSGARDVGDGGKIEWDKFSLSIPFSVFWCEWPGAAPFVPFGALVETKRYDGPFSVMTTVVCGITGQKPFFLCALEVSVKSDGKLDLMEAGDVNFRGVVNRELSEHNGQAAANQVAMTHVAEAFALMNILGCKNVGMDIREFDEPKQARVAAKRHGGTPDSYRYHVLVVRPPGAKSDHPGVEIGVMPRHVCRGHFAEYGPEFNKGLLFGKYGGRFFIPPHMKGDKKNGVVEKDYELPNPKGVSCSPPISPQA